MHPLKLVAACKHKNWALLGAHEYATPLCAEIAQDFRLNMQRIHGLLILPGFCSDFGAKGSILLEQEDRGDAPILEATQRIDDLALKDEILFQWIEALLQSVVIQSWAIVETFAERLHSECLEKHATCFRLEARPPKKFCFKKLSQLFDAFEFAFTNDTSVVASVKSKEIKGLALLRHILVHKKGVRDLKHIAECSQSPAVTLLDAFTLNQTVQIDGEMVRKLVDEAVAKCARLIAAVDFWLVAHTPK